MHMEQNWRQSQHIEPSGGWLNDPNGLCYADGKYHVFYQYTPEDAEGKGKRCWGHLVSTDDAKSWDHTGIAIRPDIPEDADGVYSGSAVVKDGVIHIFYTGNVEHPERAAYQIHITTEDGQVMGTKHVILSKEDYPEWCTHDVRDPKVWIEGGEWHMVLGARSEDNRGCVLLYEADDPDDWHYVRTLTSGDMGYMWECPDMFEIDGQKFLGVSPQGLAHEEYRNQNVYSSGYFRMENGELMQFEEYDRGFDFYAPQTFVNEYDERILFAWMGIGDIPYTNPTVEQGRQHCLTIPRKLSLTDDGHIRQWPVIHHELYGQMEEVAGSAVKDVQLPCDIIAVIEDDKYSIDIGGAAVRYSDGELILDLTAEGVGCGRTIRKAQVDKLTDLRIIVDRSSIEIFACGGRTVMSTRFYPADSTIGIRSEGGGFIVRNISEMEVRGFEW